MSAMRWVRSFFRFFLGPAIIPPDPDDPAERWQRERLETLDRAVEQDRERRADRRDRALKEEWSDD